ncbi:MarR family transcriptional regulator [Rhodovarius crocodyli]|uniref:MarR family transcriptional regulator n=1 Tax=Rhodovarius crocodyli TaxID=1979269 RepID=A0A437MP42_9PROT|nr:MarR family winged helix-turn-helix transcriptional regulator [Rhodovarius crocodyli]RVT99403.1 MarR family transcriptional regulator [Rhodovarius crocodyli]
MGLKTTPTPAIPRTTSRDALLIDGSDAEFRKLVHGLLALSTRHEALRDGHGARIGLAGPAYTILISVRDLAAQGPITVSGVAEHLKVSGAFITAETNKLETRGLVTKTRHPEDGRRVLLSVTEAGRALLADLAPVQTILNDVEFGPLTRAEFRTMLRVIERLIPAADRALELQAAMAAGDARGVA